MAKKEPNKKEKKQVKKVIKDNSKNKKEITKLKSKVKTLKQDLTKVKQLKKDIKKVDKLKTDIKKIKQQNTNQPIAKSSTKTENTLLIIGFIGTLISIILTTATLTGHSISNYAPKTSKTMNIAIFIISLSLISLSRILHTRHIK